MHDRRGLAGLRVGWWPGVSVDGVATTHDLYLNEYGGTTANLKVRSAVAAGNHTVEITATFTKNAASSG